MLLDPINAVTSVNFYRKIATQGLGRTLCYLLYVSVLFSAASTVALKVRVGPEIDKTFVWLAQSMPALTIANGKVASTAPGPVTVRHPTLAEIAVTIDTARVEPVTPEMLTSSNVIAYLTGTTLFVRAAAGRVEAYDLTKAAVGKPVTIDAAFYQSAAAALGKVLYPLAFLFGLVFALLWKIGAAILYTLVALMINAVTEAGQPSGVLFNLAAYAQTLVIALQTILLFTPASPPGFPLIALFATGAYLWLALKRLKQPAQPPPAAA